MIYKPGLHIIAELFVADTALLKEYYQAKSCIDDLIAKHSLNNLGEVYHNFSPAGFTGVVCLSESHLSLHSWPEHKRLHMDVYLSNFLKDNNTVTVAVFDSLVTFFNATIINKQILER
jgi:S-adenosylmethionine decarboxylase